MIIDKEKYIQSKWLNGNGQTVQLIINPEGSQFKLQQFDYRISIASLTTQISTFSIFQDYRRWLLILEGGPVHLFNKTKKQTYHLQALKNIVTFDGSDQLESKAQAAGKDFNLFVSKKIEASLELHTIQGSLFIDLIQGIHYIYSYGGKVQIRMENGSEWILQQGQLLQLKQNGKIILVSTSAYLIHCKINR